MKLKILLSILFFLGIAQGLLAQDVSASLTPSRIMIGDHLNLELRYKNKGYTNTIFPAINDTSMGNFRLVELVKKDTSFSGSDVVITHQYKITCFEDSVQTFPALVFQNGMTSTLHTNPIQIYVASPNVDSAKDVRPIKDVVLVPLSKAEVYSYLFVSIILLAIVVLLYWIYVKFIRKEKLFDKEKPEDPPHIKALQSLKAIENENLWQMGKIKEYYDRISDTLREYMEKRFGIKALEQTSGQILDNMHLLQLPEFIIQDMEEILVKSDLAKFAKEKHEGEQHLSILKMAYKFIQSTQMSNDVNKRTNALQVRKFYAQNKYGYKSIAINQISFKTLVYGLITTLLLLSATILLSYSIPIAYILGMIADSTYLFFLCFISAGVLLSLFAVFYMRNKLYAYLLIFDYNSVILKTKTSQKSVLYKDIVAVTVNKKSELVIEDNASNQYRVPREIEYFDEVKERLLDVAGTDSINS